MSKLTQTKFGLFTALIIGIGTMIMAMKFGVPGVFVFAFIVALFAMLG